MYEAHFGLRRRPFRSSPDLGCYYPAGCHETALARLRQALGEEEGLLLLTGLPGLGKSLLCHCLLDRLAGEYTTAFLTNSHIRDRVGLLQTLLYDLSLPHEGRGEQELRLALTDALLRNYQEGRRTLLVLDEAQHLTPDLLEELRLLSNLEGQEGKALQVLFAAQPRFLDLMHLSELAAFSQRLAVRARLEPLTVEEAADYLLHQLRLAGGKPHAVLADEALEILARSTRGVPRLLNQAAHQALVLAHGAGAEQVDAEAALEALSLLGLEEVAAEAEASRVAEAHADRGSEIEPGEAEGAEDKTEHGYRLFTTPRRPA